MTRSNARRLCVSALMPIFSEFITVRAYAAYFRSRISFLSCSILATPLSSLLSPSFDFDRSLIPISRPETELARFFARSVSWLARDTGSLASASRWLLSRRSEEHTSELQSLMRTSYAVFCLQQKNQHTRHNPTRTTYTITNPCPPNH